MPALAISIVDHRPARRGFSWRYALALVPFAMLLLVLSMRTSDPNSPGAGVKGGESSFVLVREHESRILEAAHFKQGDRFKVLLTCAPNSTGHRFVDLVVEQDNQLWYPLSVAELACGNQVPLPGAFSLDGGAARVCVLMGDKGPPPRGSIPANAMCLGLEPDS